jgi:F0F1-type ATP synthase assembly protein I
MKSLVDFICDITIAHPIWIIALCIAIGFCAGVLLVYSIVQISNKKENQKPTQMRNFLTKK